MTTLTPQHACSRGLLRLLRPDGVRIHRGLEEYGRLLKTIDILTFLSNPPYRRRVGRILSKGEAVHNLARDVAYGQLGMLTDRDFASQLNRATCLSLLINGLAVWNTRYIQAALDHLRTEEYSVLERNLEHLSSLLSGHINLHGSHHFDFQAPQYARDSFVPGVLRCPSSEREQSVVGKRVSSRNNQTTTWEDTSKLSVVNFVGGPMSPSLAF